jgi:hypothetical protein
MKTVYYVLVQQPPAYQNPVLQKQITCESGDTLHLSGMNVTDDDMQIVVFYGIQEKKVY